MDTKRGQITVFIIIGVVILLIIGVIIALTIRSDTETITGTDAPIATRAPLEAQPVQDFVEGCVHITAKEGLRLLGDRGGYITKQFSYDPLRPTNGDGVQFAPGSNLIIPYWYHLKSKDTCNGDCVFETQRPALFNSPGEQSIEGQLNTYIKDNLNSCLKNFQTFKDRKVTPTGEITTATTITKNKVHVLVEYPIIVEHGSLTTIIEEFGATLNVNILEMYTLATDIVNLEAKSSYLEAYTKQMIDIYSGVDSKKLPPMSELRIDFGPGEFWLEREVQKNLKSVFHSYIPLLQVYGSRNYQFIDSPVINDTDPEIYELLYNRGALIPLENTPRNLNVKFTFLDWWNPYLDLSCRGELCNAESLSNTYGFIFGIQRYNFAYDMSYPVLVEIDNPDAFNGEGYSFKYFMEVNMRSNEALASNFKSLEALPLPVGTYLCDGEKRLSGDVNVTIIDGKTRMPAERAFLSYYCGTEACSLPPVLGGKDTIKLPLCIGGAIAAQERIGLATFEPLDTFLDEPDEIAIVMQPFRQVRIDLKNYVLRKNFASWDLDTNNRVSQEADEETFIQFERVTNDYEEPYSVVSVIRGDAFTRDAISTGVQLVPGTYRVTISTFKYADPGIIIPPRDTTVDSGPFSSDKKVTLPGTEFNSTNPFPMVGSEFEWVVTAADLDRHDSVTFHGIKIGLDSVPESDRRLSDLEVLSLEGYYQAYKSLLAPQWVDR